MHNFRRLEVWEDSLVLAERIYKLTSGVPSDERYGLTARIRSAAVSNGSNIAEGPGRGSPGELARFIRIALGSIAEMHSQLELAVRLGIMEAQPDLVEFTRILSKRLSRLHDRITETRP